MKLRIITLCLLLSSLFLDGCSTNELKQEGQRAEISVKTIPVTEDTLIRYTELNGVLQANQVVPIFSLPNTPIQEVHVKTGDHVNKNDLLLTFNSQMIDMKLSMLNNKRTEAYKMLQDLNNQKEWKGSNSWFARLFPSKEDAIAKQAMGEFRGLNAQTLKGKIAELEGAIQEAELMKKAMNTLAPISGEVVIPTLSAQKSESSDPLLVIADISKLRGIFYANQFQVQNINKNQTATLYVDGTDQLVETSVLNVSSVASPTTQMYEVQFKVDNPYGLFKAGMTASAKVITDQSNHALVIPTEAIVYRDNQPFVFIADGHKAQKRNITVGIQENGKVEVVEGLNKGEKVITEGKEYITSGDRITY